VVEAFAANRADDAFHVGALPRGSRCRQNFLDFEEVERIGAEMEKLFRQLG
jgi:hypothetical protein